MDSFGYEICVVGRLRACRGLPWDQLLAHQGLKVCVYDIDERAVAMVRSGRMPFRERSAVASSAR